MPSETIELRGHIIDSLILPKVLDEIIARGGSFKIGEIRIGEQRTDQSFARIEVEYHRVRTSSTNSSCGSGSTAPR